METIAEETVHKILQMSGAAAIPIGVVLLIAVVKSVFDFAGNPGKSIASWQGKGLRQRASDWKDAKDQNDEAAALRGSKLARFRRMGANGRQRRALRNQDAQANLEAAQGQFGLTDKKAGAYTQAIAQNKAISSAINHANNTALVNNLANNPNLLKDMLGDKAKEDNGLDEALKVQQEKAVADAIKDVELKANFDPGDVKSIGEAMVKAIKEGDSIGARAHQNMLMRAGGPGTEQYRESMGKITQEDMAAGTSSAAAVNDIKRNMLVNHGNVKETAADLIKHASAKANEDGVFPTMQEVSNAAGTWSMSSEDLVKQKTHSIKAAAAANGISFDQANEIKNDEQLYRKLDKGGKEAIQGVIDRTLGLAQEEAAVQNKLFDMNNRK